MHDLCVADQFNRRQSGERLLRPVRSLLGEIEIEVNAISGAFAAQGFQPRVDVFADLAEMHIRRVAQRQHRESHAIEARRGIAHEGGVEIDGAGRRIALAPGRGIDDEIFHFAQIGEIEIRHIENFGI